MLMDRVPVVELLVPLTWPVEPHSQMTVNHHKHTPYLQYSQIAYKRGILGWAKTGILRTIIRIGSDRYPGMGASEPIWGLKFDFIKERNRFAGMKFIRDAERIANEKANNSAFDFITRLHHIL